MDINLDDIIASLNRRFNELNNYTFVEPDPTEENRKTLQLHRILTDLNEEITKYERIRVNSNAATITINPVSDQERQELLAVLSDLDVAIRQDEVWHRAISLGTAVLEAAATIRSKAAVSPPSAPAVAGAMALANARVTAASDRVSRLLARHAKSSGQPVKAKNKAAKRRKRT